MTGAYLVRQISLESALGPCKAYKRANFIVSRGNLRQEETSASDVAFPRGR